MDDSTLRTRWEDALRGDRRALRAVLGELTVVVRCRVIRSLLRRTGASRGRDLHQEASELTQEVMVALFGDMQRALRAWDPERGLGLAGFVGMLAEHEVASILRSRRRNPWAHDPTAPDELEEVAPRSAAPEHRAIDRDLMTKLLARLEDELSPLGMQVFSALWRDEKEVSEVMEELEMSSEAVWAWRSRIRKRAHRIHAELLADEPARAEEIR